MHSGPCSRQIAIAFTRSEVRHRDCFHVLTSDPARADLRIYNTYSHKLTFAGNAPFSRSTSHLYIIIIIIIIMPISTAKGSHNMLCIKYGQQIIPCKSQICAVNTQIDHVCIRNVLYYYSMKSAEVQCWRHS